MPLLRAAGVELKSSYPQGVPHDRPHRSAVCEASAVDERSPALGREGSNHGRGQGEYRAARKSRLRAHRPSARNRHALLPAEGKPQTRRRQPRPRPQSLLRRTRRPRTHRRRHPRPHDQSDARHPPSRQRPTARTLARNRMGGLMEIGSLISGLEGLDLAAL